ncbi:MAG: protein kinase [Chloroflexota bacterium]
MSFSIGTVVGPYEIVERVGQGGMATVYKAHHAKLDRHVAIKVLHPAFRDDDAFLRRFGREARLVASLDHPHIVPIYDFAEHEGQPYLVMRYVDGETLKERRERGAMGAAEVGELITAVSSALDYAHNKGILHRDIKPSNILLDSSGKAYLTDFGLARLSHVGETTISHDTIVGTPHYISPEQAKGVKNLDQRTDIYSFGVIVYQLLTGQVPFQSETPYAVVHSHIFDKPPQPRVLNPAISEELEEALLVALSKSPNGRFPTAGTFAEIIVPALTALPDLSTPTIAPDYPDLPPLPDLSELEESSQSMSTIPMMQSASTTRAKGDEGPKRPFFRRILPAFLVLLLLVAALFIVRRVQQNNNTATPLPTTAPSAVVDVPDIITATDEPQPTPPATEEPPPPTLASEPVDAVPTPDLTAVPALEAIRALPNVRLRDATVEQLYEEIAADPDNGALYVNLVAAYIVSGQTQQARQLIDIIFDDSRPLAYQRAAEELLTAEQPVFAMLVLADAVNEFPNDVNITQMLMLTLILNDESDSAVQELLKRTDDRPRNGTIRGMAAAFSAYRDGDYSQALEHIQRAKQQAQPAALANLVYLEGLIHIQLEDRAEALAAFEEALTLNPPPWLKTRIEGNIARLTDQ